MAKSAGVRRPSKPRVPMQGGMCHPYEQPPWTSGVPKPVRSAGMQQFRNVSTIKPGQGTSGDGTTARKIGR
jgi:hypothetical protein